MGPPTHKRPNGIVGVRNHVVVTPALRRTKEIAASISEKFWGWQDYIDKKPAWEKKVCSCCQARIRGRN